MLYRTTVSLAKNALHYDGTDLLSYIYKILLDPEGLEVISKARKEVSEVLGENKELRTRSMELLDVLEKAWKKLHESINNPGKDIENLSLNTVLAAMEELRDPSEFVALMRWKLSYLIPKAAETVPMIFQVEYSQEKRNLIISIPPLKEEEKRKIREIWEWKKRLYFNYLKEIASRMVKIDTKTGKVKIGELIEFPVEVDSIPPLAAEMKQETLDDFFKLKLDETLTDIYKKNLIEIRKTGEREFLLKFKKEILMDEAAKELPDNATISIYISIEPKAPLEYSGHIEYSDNVANIKYYDELSYRSLRILIRGLINSLEGKIVNYYREYKKLKNMLEKSGFEWRKFSLSNIFTGTGIYAVKTWRKGRTTIKTEIESKVDKGESYSQSIISIKSPLINEIYSKIIGNIEGWYTEKKANKLIIGLKDKPEKISDTVVKTLDLLAVIQEVIDELEGKIIREKSKVQAKVEDYAIIYLIKKFVARDMNLYEVTGTEDIVVYHKTAEALLKHKILPSWMDKNDVTDTLINEPDKILKEVVLQGVKVDDNLEPLILGTRIEDALSRFPRLSEKYSTEILAKMLKRTIYMKHYEYVGITPVRELLWSGKADLQLIKKLIDYGSPVELELLISEIEGKPLWNHLTREEKALVLSKLDTSDLRRLLKTGLVRDKADLYDVISTICKQSTGDLCTRMIIHYSPKLAGFPKDVQTITINDEMYIDVGTYALQVRRIGPVNEYKIYSKTDKTEIIVEADNPVNAIYKAIKKPVKATVNA